MMNTLGFSDFQSTASKLFTAYASLTASMMLVRTVAKDLIPHPFRSYLLSAFSSFFDPLSNQTTISIDELTGMSRNQVYDSADAYLRTKIGPETRRLDLAKTHKQNKFELSIAKDQEIIDTYKNAKLKWRLGSIEQTSSSGSKMMVPGNGTRGVRRFFELSFNKKFRELVLDDYLPFVFRRAEEIKESDRTLKLYTMNSYLPKGDFSEGRGHGPWGCISLDHPATFDTIAMEPEMKREIIEDLERFVRRKDYYKKVGKAWKRGYLLYGPPGTGKSSLVAAMANYLMFDIYDVELTMMHSDAELRRILVSTTNRSIIVIEDIDCSVESVERAKFGRAVDVAERARLSLSGLLNFLDGLWSSCGDERIIVFTTNHKDRLDPALLRPGRMDMHIHMSYCTNIGFKILALNYLGVEEWDQPRLFREIGGLIKSVEATPAEIAEELMRREDPALALQGVANLLKRKRDESVNGNNENSAEDGSDVQEKRMRGLQEQQILDPQGFPLNGPSSGNGFFKTF